jgi:hypothetical protein
LPALIRAALHSKKRLGSARIIAAQISPPPAHVCKQVIPDLKTPYLNHYIRDRNAVMEKVMKGAGIDKGAAKQVILAIMNGGKADYEKLDPKPIFLSKFKAECGDIWAAMILADPNR